MEKGRSCLSRRGPEHWFDLGDVAVVPLVENARLLIEPAEFFPELGAARAGWCFEPPWYDRDAGSLVYAIQSFLVIAPGQTVLVDACVGDGKPRVRPEFDHQDSGWFAAFEATGLRPTEVDDVVLTHLHVDHVGWATRPDGGSWVPVFPAARHHVTRQEHRYWQSADGAAAMRRTGDYLADSVEPLLSRGLLRLTTPDAVIGPRIRLVPAPGHTPGNVCVQVSGSTTELLITGDVVHHPLQLRHPEWSTRYCVDPAEATRTRLAVLGRLADVGTPMLPAHFAAPSVGRVVRRGDGYRFEPARDIVRAGRYVRHARPAAETPAETPAETDNTAL